MNFDYSDSGELRGLGFRMDFDGPVYFLLTPNIEGVLRVMTAQKAPRHLLNLQQACRVAWRIEKDWLEAQLAKIESGLATPMQLLLPYAVTSDGTTFYQRMLEGTGPKLLGS